MSCEHCEKPTFCDSCENTCNIAEYGNSISIQFPYGSSLDGNYNFCSLNCLLKFVNKNRKEDN